MFSGEFKTRSVRTLVSLMQARYWGLAGLARESS